MRSFQSHMHDLPSTSAANSGRGRDGGSMTVIAQQMLYHENPYLRLSVRGVILVVICFLAWRLRL